MTRATRNGFTLLEVLMATAVLLGGVLVLSQIAYIGRRHAERAEMLAAAQLVCKAHMNDLLIGGAAIEAVHEQPLPEMPGWLLSVETEPVGQSGLVALRVTAAEEALEMDEEYRLSFSLVRWIPDPDRGLDSRSRFGASRADDFLLPQGRLP